MRCANTRLKQGMRYKGSPPEQSGVSTYPGQYSVTPASRSFPHGPLHGVVQFNRPCCLVLCGCTTNLHAPASKHAVSRLPSNASPVVKLCGHRNSPQYLGRKTLPIKRADAEPLTREDLQYDLLYFIFADPTRAFVDSMAPGKPLVNFCDLYVNALFNSNKCSKVLKDKMLQSPQFATDFAMLALLANTGRINTTMSCMFFTVDLGVYL